MSIKEDYEAIKKLITEMDSDVEKFEDKGNGAAGTRIRKGLQDIKKHSQDLRLKVQDIKNSKN